jgi:MYXO-CTERM domain-containing protein
MPMIPKSVSTGVKNFTNNLSTQGLGSAVRSSVGSNPYRKGAAAAGAVVGAGALMRRRKSGLDSTPGRPTGMRQY